MKANQYVEGESSQWPPPGSFFLTYFEVIPLNGIDAAMYFEFDGVSLRASIGVGNFGGSFSEFTV